MLLSHEEYSRNDQNKTFCEIVADEKCPNVALWKAFSMINSMACRFTGERPSFEWKFDTETKKGCQLGGFRRLSSKPKDGPQFNLLPDKVCWGL